MMHALEVTAPGRIQIVDRTPPVPRADTGSVLVRPRLVGLCGTDLDIIDGGVDPSFVHYPIVLGHEWVGQLPHELGGGLVVVEGVVPCGACRACSRGATNLCESYEEFGFTLDGAATGLLSVPTGQVHRLHPSVGAETAVLAEPAAVVQHAIARADPQPGARVLVVGDGTIGLLAAHLVRASSPDLVVVHGRRAAQEALVSAAGADRLVLDEGLSAAGYDLVIDASGSPHTIGAVLNSAGRGASIVLLGYAGTGVTTGFPIDEVVNRELSVFGSFASTPADWRSIVARFNSNDVELSWLVTHQYPLADFASAIAELRRPSGPRGKIVLVPS